jgi:hypothetical protein
LYPVRLDSDPLKLVAGKLVPERSDSTSSVDSRSSGISGKGEGRAVKRKSHQAFSSKLTPTERSDSTSSVDSHATRKEGVGEKGGVKHARKAQPVFVFGQKTTTEKEEGKKGLERGSGKSERADSLSISVDWGALPSGRNSLSNTPTTAPAGGFTFPAKEVEAEGKDVSPTLVSLPLHFSARASDTGESSSSTTPLSDPYHGAAKFPVSTGPVKPGPSTAALTLVALKKMRAQREAEKKEKAREESPPPRCEIVFTFVV